MSAGIWAQFGGGTQLFSGFFDKWFGSISHRAKEEWRVHSVREIKKCFLAFFAKESYSIKEEMQPMKLYNNYILICDGSIYNVSDLRAKHPFQVENKGHLECIIHLYRELGMEECLKKLDGVFAFCLIDIQKRLIFIARDLYGVRPLFRTTNKKGFLAVCSEGKGLVSARSHYGCLQFGQLPPGTFEEYTILSGDNTAEGKVKRDTVMFVRSKRYLSIGQKLSFFQELDNNHETNIRELLLTAVRKRVLTTARVGVILGPTVQSMLLAAMVVQVVRSVELPYRVQTFSIGVQQGVDMQACREVAAHINSFHHEVIYGERHIFDSLNWLIYLLETPDPRIVKSAMVMYLTATSDIVPSTSTRILISSIGADELFQGYPHFAKAPTPEDGHNESIRLLNDLHMFDLMSADRTMEHIEVKYPFLDMELSHYILNMPPELRQPRNNYGNFLLRTMYASTNLIPDDYIWRNPLPPEDPNSEETRMNQLIEAATITRTPEVFDAADAAERFSHCTPQCKLELFYRLAFEHHFPRLLKRMIPYFWHPKW